MGLLGAEDWMSLGANMPDETQYQANDDPFTSLEWGNDYSIATDPNGGFAGTMYGGRNWDDGSEDMPWTVGGWEDVSFSPPTIAKGQGSGKTGIPLGTIGPYQGYAPGGGGGAAPVNAMVAPASQSAYLPGLAKRGGGLLESLTSGVNWKELAIGGLVALVVGKYLLKR